MTATFSAVAYLKDGKTPTIIPIPENGRTMASLVSLDQDGVATVGRKAEESCNQEPYRNVKRVIGTGGKLSAETIKVVPFLRPSATGKSFKNDNLANQISDAQEHPSLLVSQSNSTELIRPEIISSHIVQTLKRVAQEYTGCHVTRAVIGVPAYFHDEQREATKRAAELAGFEKVKLLREPEAAALAYGIGKQQVTAMENEIDDTDNDDELVLVFDLGGGTFDVSMLLVGGGLTEVLCTSGNAGLGGSNFDARLADYFQRLLNLHGSSTTTTTWSETSLSCIVQAAESTRIYLSNSKRVSLALPLEEQAWRTMDSPDTVILKSSSHEPNSTASGVSNSTHVLCVLSRRDMESLFLKELQDLLRPVREVAIMAGALLPGDTSPALAEAALDMEEFPNTALFFDDFYNTDNPQPDPDKKDVDNDNENLLLHIQEMDTKAVKKAQQRGRKKARNLSKQERKFRQEKRKLTQGSSSSPNTNNAGEGIKVRDGIAGRPISRVVLVGGATRMPAVGRLVGALTGTVPQRTINPDEAVALGCAVHVGILDGAQDMGTVLNPMQAAILKAVAMQKAKEGKSLLDD